MPIPPAPRTPSTSYRAIRCGCDAGDRAVTAAAPALSSPVTAVTSGAAGGTCAELTAELSAAPADIVIRLLRPGRSRRRHREQLPPFGEQRPQRLVQPRLLHRPVRPSAQGGVVGAADLLVQPHSRR